MRVLLVEDEPGVRDVVERVLVRRGHTVAAFGDGAEAWEACRRELFPLVVLDVVVPGVDGLELCRRLRALPDGGAPAVLVVTGVVRPGDLERVLDAGADDYLAKPFGLEALTVRLAVLERLAATRAVHADAEAALARAEERTRLAMDLHDGAIQRLFGLAMQLGAAERTLSDPERARGALRDAHGRIGEISTELRGYIQQLRAPAPNPAEAPGVAPTQRRMVRPPAVAQNARSALKALAEDLRRAGLAVDLSVAASGLAALDARQLAELVFVAREAASNALRHGRAGRVRIRLAARGGAAVLTVHDDGVGFEPAVRAGDGHGLANMAARAHALGGELRLVSAPGRGTQVRVRVPLAPGAGGAPRSQQEG